MKRISPRLSDDLIARIDALRGSIPVTTYIHHLLVQAVIAEETRRSVSRG